MSDRQHEPILTPKAPEILFGWAIVAVVAGAIYWAAISYPTATLTVGKIGLCWLVLWTPVWIFRLLRRR